MTAQEIGSLRARAARLEGTIVDEDARDHLLRPVKNWLGDVERKAVPGIEAIMLPLIDRQLRHAEELVDKYGPNVRFVG